MIVPSLALLIGEAYIPDSQISAHATASPDGNFASADLFSSIQNDTFPEWCCCSCMHGCAHYLQTHDWLLLLLVYTHLLASMTSHSICVMSKYWF